MPIELKITIMQCIWNIFLRLSYEVDVLHADKHESLLQVDSIIYGGFGEACPKYLCNILRKKSGMKLGP